MKAILTDIAREAGKIMLRHFRKISELQIEKKGVGTKDLVTFVDREVEKQVFERLRDEFPDHDFIGEEFGKKGEADGVHFIVDPVDGTTNYAQGLPHFGITIARKENDEVTHGLIYLPVFNEMYYAEKGNGASLNGEPITVSKRDKMEDCVIATGFACVRGQIKPDTVPVFADLIYVTRDLRRLGAASADLAYVARGIFDGFYEIGLAPWDVCAGALIIKEAGGQISGFGGDEDYLSGKRILASNGIIHDELKERIEKVLKNA